MGIEKVRDFFKEFGEEIIELKLSSATVELAARALNCEEKRIAKTLAFKAGDKNILIVTAGDAKIDNAKYKGYFKLKAKMLSPQEVLENIGHEIGGVCPFGVNDGVTVYLDDSLKRFDTVFPACGSNNSAIELSIEKLERYAGAKEWVDICKDWR
ncbi:MAG: YbaK/EbsC family protein [Campylobacteraceae bacterium]|nr:YbaK/EbsC family protein [Campylobacteraceae bacterium]